MSMRTVVHEDRRDLFHTAVARDEMRHDHLDDFQHFLVAFPGLGLSVAILHTQVPPKTRYADLEVWTLGLLGAFCQDLAVKHFAFFYCRSGENDFSSPRESMWWHA